ncbi:putative holin-like toxin [Gorillibacterium sp. CAU 1737]
MFGMFILALLSYLNKKK